MNSENGKEMKYSTKIQVSYAIGGFLDAFLTASFNMRVIYYFENEIFLSITLIGIAFAIYGFWNMVNDPLLGFQSDKKTRFTEKWGRRFPWFLIGAILINFVYILIYIVPFTDQLGIFIWLLVLICLFELCYSLWQVNWLALFPDKYRSHKERTKIGAFTTIWNLFGNALAFIITPLIVSYGDRSSYTVAAIVVAVVAYVLTVFLIPGMREDKELIERELRMIDKQKKKRRVIGKG